MGRLTFTHRKKTDTVNGDNNDRNDLAVKRPVGRPSKKSLLKNQMQKIRLARKASSRSEVNLFKGSSLSGRPIVRKLSPIELFQAKTFPLSLRPLAIDANSFQSYALSRNDVTEAEKQTEREELITLTECILEFSDNSWSIPDNGSNCRECTFTDSYRVQKKDYSPDLLRFKILDADDLGMTRNILKVYPKATIYICNPCAKLIAENQIYKELNQKFPGQIHLYAAYEFEQMRHLADIQFSGPEGEWKSIPTCTTVWYDTCGAFKDTDKETIELYFHLGMFSKTRPSVFSATFCNRDAQTSLTPEIRKAHKSGYMRTEVDDFIQMCARDSGYLAIRPSRLMFPRLKSSRVYSWSYIIVSAEWWAENLERSKTLEQHVNWALEKFRDISNDKELPAFRDDLFYEPKKIQLPKV
jgi:hypothetical protein